MLGNPTAKRATKSSAGRTSGAGAATSTGRTFDAAAAARATAAAVARISDPASPLLLLLHGPSLAAAAITATIAAAAGNFPQLPLPRPPNQPLKPVDSFSSGWQQGSSGGYALLNPALAGAELRVPFTVLIHLHRKLQAGMDAGRGVWDKAIICGTCCFSSCC